MPTFSFTVGSYTPFTKILSANVNQDKTDITTFLNTTKLDDSNIQVHGLTRNGSSSRLKAGTANYVVINNSSGDMTEEQYLALSRGGAGTDLTSGVATGYVPTYNGSVYAPASPVPTGVTFPYVGTTAPSGYLLCDGSPVSRTTYATLFALLSTTYGQGDGSTTFNVPDMRGMFMRGSSNWLTDSVTASSNGGILFTGTAGKVTRTGQQLQFTASGLPGNISASTTYYAIYVSSTTYRVATSLANALSGTAVAYSSSGTAVVANNFVDYGAAGRTQFTSGSTSTAQNPGSYQLDEFPDHTHTIGAYGNSLITGAGAPQGNAAAQTYTVTSSGATITSANSQTTLGAEVRPMNVAFNYIIKY